MKQFLERLWRSPLKGFLIALPAVAIGIVVNRLTGPSGEVQLPAQLATDLLMIWVGIVGSVCGVAYSYHQKLEEFKKEHEEETVTFEKIDFVRGKRTLNRWIGVCPKCAKPVEDAAVPQLGRYENAKVIACSARCGWQIFENRLITDIAREVSKIRP
jgi:hypothetical protein